VRGALARPDGRWRRLLRPDADLLDDAGAAGELLVARVRLAVAVLLLLIPVSNTRFDVLTSEQMVGVIMTTGTVAIAAVIYLIVRRERRLPWLGFATGLLDVTAVSIALSLFLVQGAPHTAVNSKVVFECYFLAIAATCLRHDVRITLLAGLMAVLQYLGICVWADTYYDLNGLQYAPFDYGTFSWATQVNRLILLVAATALAAAIVLRSRDLRRLSTIDRLTAIANRGWFDERFESELSRRRRTGAPLAVLMLDVDHFKEFNDRFGHAAGDEALRRIAAALRRTLRRSDLLARYGGEEFVVLLPETGAAEALAKAEVLRRTILALPVWTGRGATAPALTASIGVASAPDDGETSDVLLASADARLFHAKHAGRNCVVGAGPSSGAVRTTADA
jgi:diguanylate cyclase (GGDEF)-like protein